MQLLNPAIILGSCVSLAITVAVPITETAPEALSLRNETSLIDARGGGFTNICSSWWIADGALKAYCGTGLTTLSLNSIFTNKGGELHWTRDGQAWKTCWKYWGPSDGKDAYTEINCGDGKGFWGGNAGFLNNHIYTKGGKLTYDGHVGRFGRG